MINIDYSRDENLTEQAMKVLREYYMLEDEKSPQDAFARAALAYCGDDYDFAQRIYDYASKQWFMFASPVLSNAPKRDGKVSGLPISCFLTYVGDNLHSIFGHRVEVGWLSAKGGGVGGHWSDVRGISKKAPGPIPFIKVVDSMMLSDKQGTTRKGSYAAYLDVDHPDIWEFIETRVPVGGDIDRRFLNLFPAVNITDAFMEALKHDDDWELRDPHDGSVRDVYKARAIWARILEARLRTGTPYINFIDTANRGLPENQRKLGLRINGSNLCNEIHLPTSEERTAVCCLSSVNLEKWDDWKDTRMVRDLVRFLDNVLQFFIDNAPEELAKAKFSAERERSIGLGAMGFHGYLQSKGIPWEVHDGDHTDFRAAGENYKIFKQIKEQAVEESKQLAKERGEAPDMEGTGMRNAHLLAIAPNANSSIVCGCSASIEPIKSNAYTHRTRAGSHLVTNKYLAKVLEKYGKNDDKTWSNIISNEGSVQHLDFLSDDEKRVFKTAFEINQDWVVEHAAKRQEFICQGQSVNVFFPTGIDRSYVNSVHIKAWVEGLKGLYYLRSEAGVSADKVGLQVERNALKDFDGDECVSCQG